jgi:thiol reductant ABC exporter CydC subunit
VIAASRSRSAESWAKLGLVARLRPGEGRRLSLSVLLSWGAVMAGLGLMTASGYLISRAAQRPAILALATVITAVRGFALARAVLRYLERLVSHDLALKVLARLRSGFYAALAPLGVATLGDRRRGDLLARFVADVDSLEDLYLRGLAPPLVAALVILAAGITAAIMLPAAGLVLVISLTATAILVPIVTAVVASRAGRHQAQARARLTDELVDALEGSVELAVAGRAEQRVERIDDASRHLARIGMRDALAGAGATTLQALCVGATVMLVLLVAIPAVHGGTLSPVLLAAVVMLSLGAFEGLQPLPLAARRLRACAVAAGRLEDLASLAPPVADPAAPRTLAEDAEPALTVEHVSFAFDDGTQVLDDVSLALKPACRIALGGPSGTGKSTLSELLVRFVDPSAGVIRLGGIDLRELALDDVRRSVVLIAQDAHVFTTTVRENLRLAGREASDDELWSALAAVRLDGLVRSLPDGLDTLVGEDGDLLSGGQRQRLTVARALLADARFIVLDEPTAQLDRETARELIAAIDSAAGDRGLLVITHRLSEVAGFDAIYELADGRLRAGAAAARRPEKSCDPN